MKKFLVLFFALLVSVSVYAQAPQYGRFYKTLTQSTEPTQSCLLGTLLFNTTNSHQYVCSTTSNWLDLTSQTSVTPYLRSQYEATVNTNVLAVTWVTGDKFDTGWAGHYLTINGVEYLVSSVASNIALTLTGTAGNQNGVLLKSDYAYIWNWNDGEMDHAGTARKAYGLNIALGKTAAVTGDSNDAIIKLTYNNYAVNDTNFVMYGINSLVSNRNGGRVGLLKGGLISAVGRTGSTTPYIKGLEVGADNFGTTATEFGGIDVLTKNEGAKATTEYGVRVTNIQNSLAYASGAAFKVAEQSKANTGWDYIIDANSVESPLHAFARMQNGAVIYYGTQTTRDTVRSEVGTAGAVGSLYVSTVGKLYIKVATAGATSDWQVVASSAGD